MQESDCWDKRASTCGQVEVLQWWKDSGLELQYDESVLIGASCGGQIAVLEWWQESGLELRYDRLRMRTELHGGRS